MRQITTVRRCGLAVAVACAGFAGAAAAIDSPDELLNAPVPSACEHPAGTLVDGELPGIPDGEGEVVLDTSHVALGAVVPGRGTGAVAALTCNRGGVGWPQVIVVYDRDLRLLGSLDLLAVTHGGREHVRRLRLIGRIAEIQVVNIGRPDDPGCCGTRSATLRLVYDRERGAVRVVSRRFFDERGAAEALVAALRRGAMGTARRWASPRALGTILAATTPATRRSLRIRGCFGVLGDRGPLLGTAPRGCTLSVRVGGRPSTVGVLRMRPVAWNRWRASDLVT
ncbi:MAG: hypothetical protein IT200_03985 [Thermoleophilia bacterium]|nr:hypothetical protein [Thermoleophilia bacterium]